MPIERTTGGTSLIDVLDRVLDKGIVIDAWVRVSLVGIDLITVEARVVVASIDTYLKYSESISQVSPVSRPAAVASQEAVLAENAALRAQLAATPSGPTRRGPTRRGPTRRGPMRRGRARRQTAQSA
jgi:gas vesicle structural protein